MKKRSLMIMGHSTSVSMEDEFWSMLKKISEHKKLTVQQLVEQIDMQRDGNLSSALRVFILNWLCDKLEKNTEQNNS
ncbi:MAG: ribbon-helix-helix domain-containing protein [Alphaproteobacteria bacterium]|nr:ribbon-helix-helix domain-containing protein [Alphaproteobacteria bacterium]